MSAAAHPGLRSLAMYPVLLIADVKSTSTVIAGLIAGDPLAVSDFLIAGGRNNIFYPILPAAGVQAALGRLFIRLREVFTKLQDASANVC